MVHNLTGLPRHPSPMRRIPRNESEYMSQAKRRRINTEDTRRAPAPATHRTSVIASKRSAAWQSINKRYSPLLSGLPRLSPRNDKIDKLLPIHHDKSDISLFFAMTKDCLLLKYANIHCIIHLHWLITNARFHTLIC